MSQFRRPMFGSRLRGNLRGTRARKLIRSPVQIPTVAVGLLAYYTMSDVNDSSGNGRNLTNNAGVTFVPGKVGNCGRFAAASSQFLSRTDTGLAISGNLSVACWVKFASATDFKRMVSRFVQGTGGYTMATTPTNGVAWGCVGTGGTANAVSANLNNDQWYHLIGTFELTGSIASLYVDNGAAITDTIISGGGMATPDVDFMIGAFDSTPTNFMDGDIDEVAIWNRVLTADERTYLYNGGNGRTWPL